MASSPFKGEVGRGMGEEVPTDHPVSSIVPESLSITTIELVLRRQMIARRSIRVEFQQGLTAKSCRAMRKKKRAC